jgi:preprotein translocase subunit SecA
VTKVFSDAGARQEDEEAIEAADMQRHLAQLAQAVPKHDELAAAPRATPAPEAPASEPEPPLPPPPPAVLSEQECPCGSGKAFSKCHGVEDEASA